MVNPAFEAIAPTGGDLEAGPDETSTDELQRESTIDLMTDEKRPSLSPWNNLGSSGSRRQTGARTSGSKVAKRSETASTYHDDEPEDSDDDAPPGLDVTADDR